MSLLFFSKPQHYLADVRCERGHGIFVRPDVLAKKGRGRAAKNGKWMEAPCELVWTYGTCWFKHGRRLVSIAETGVFGRRKSKGLKKNEKGKRGKQV